MKQKFKFLSVNILIILVLFSLFDIVLYYRYLYMSHQYKFPYKDISYSKRISKDYSLKSIDKIIFKEKKFRNTENLTSSKKSILLFGCSFIQGHMLEDNQTISYKLSKISDRPIYNRADGGWGPQHMLFQLKSPEIKKVINKSPEYIIYTYIHDHINRIGVAMEPMIYGGIPTFKYKSTNDKLVYSPFDNYTFKFPLLNIIRQSYYIHFVNQKEKSELLKKHFLSSKYEISKLWPDAKFIIFVYEAKYEMLSIIDSLRDEGIYVITFQDLMDGESPQKKGWTISDTDNHPSALAWEHIAPKLNSYIENLDKNPIINNHEKNMLEFEERYYLNSKKEYLKILFLRDFPSAFSLCTRDRVILETEKISQCRINLAYIIWSIGNFIQCHSKLNVQNYFSKIAAKLNPYNESYRMVQ